MLRLVLDTNIIVTALKSPQGASAHLLRLARNGHIMILANVALCLEYEAVCLRPEIFVATGLVQQHVQSFVDVVIALCEPVETHFLWRPCLRDPDDEFVLEAAVNGMANAIVTFNKRDFAAAVGRFSLKLLTPSEALKVISK